MSNAGTGQEEVEYQSSESGKGAAAGRLSSDDATRWLYAGTAFLLLVLTFWGFHNFYLHGQTAAGTPLRPPIQRLAMAHGIAMSLWLILLVVQSLLVARHRVRLHMRLGLFGVALAACILVLGLMVVIGRMRVSPDRVLPALGITMSQFLEVPFMMILAFGAFASIGFLNRKRPQIHRPMMLFATLMAVGPATGRIAGFFRQAGSSNLLVSGIDHLPLIIGMLFLIAISLIRRSIHRPAAVMLASFALISWGIGAFRTTAAWDGIASFLVSNATASDDSVAGDPGLAGGRAGVGGAQAQVERLDAALDLTDEQKAGVTAIYDQAREALQARGGSSGGRSGATVAIMVKVRTDVRALLTPDQQEQFDALPAGRGRGGRGGAPQ